MQPAADPPRPTPTLPRPCDPSPAESHQDEIHARGFRLFPVPTSGTRMPAVIQLGQNPLQLGSRHSGQRVRPLVGQEQRFGHLAAWNMIHCKSSGEQ